MKKKTLESLTKKIIAFNGDRGWNKASTIDFAKSIVIEAAELLEKFQWDESDRDIKGTEQKNWEEIADEVADIYWYLITFCISTNINLSEAVSRKISKLEVKYPAEMFKGKHNDRFYKAQKMKYREAKTK